MSHDHPDNRGRTGMQTIGLPNPIPIFEAHLRELDISYIPFFEERIKIEETYIGNLVALHQKSRAEDARFEQGVEVPSLRKAWYEVRDNLDREAECRNAFVAALKNDVLAPLVTLRETQDRTRKRIKEEIKESTQSHTDYLENTLPRLKRNYMRKMQDVEDYKTSERQVIPPPQPHVQIPQAQYQPGGNQNPSPTNSSFTSTSTSYTAVTPVSPPRAPPVSSPQPGYALSGNNNAGANRPSSQQPYSNQRTRSPSATTSLSDLAHHGKKALMGFLAEGPARPGGIISSINVRAKREGEEADKEYRKGVHWLETLRLKRATTIRSGYTSIEDFIWEKGVTIKSIMENYMNCLMGTASSVGNVAMHPMPNLKKVSLEQDRAYQTRFLGRVDAALKQSLPQTLYVNHLVGASKDLIFGVSLVDYATERGLTGGPGIALGLAGIAKVQGSEAQGTVVPPNDKDKSRPAPLTSWEDAVPKLVRKCITEVERRGLYQEGIYRVSGRLAVVQELRHVVEKDETAFEFNPQTDDVFCVASLLKAYLRELPEPVFRFPLQERIQHTEDRDDQIQMKFPVLRNKMRRLPFVHQATLRMIIEHLSHIAGRAHQNKMDARNLAIVFGTPLFGEDEMPKGDNVLSISSWKDSVLEDMINYAGLLFDEKGPSTPPASSISVPTNLNVTPPPVPPGKEYDAYPENREASPPGALNADPNVDSRPQRNAGSSSPAPSSPGNPAISNVKGDDRARSPTPPPLPPRARGVETLSPTSPTDFAPRLPARPNYSIHPGAKRGPNDVNEEDISSPGGGAISPVPVFDSQGNKITVITPPPGWKEGTENGASNLLSPTDSVGRGRDVNANAGNNRSTGARSPTPTAL